MKKIYLLILVFSSFIFAQSIAMQRVESLYSVEAYPVGKIVSINGLGDIFAVNSGSSEVYVLKNGSNTWSKILDYCGTVSGIYNSSDNAVLIKTSNGLYYSSNTSTYSLTQILVETTAFCVVENSSGTIYCGSTDGLYKSDNNGTSWSITYEYPLKMALSSTDIMYVDEYNKGLCRSTDFGITWEEINYNLPKDSVINDIQVTTDGTVFISVKNNGIYKLSGTEWVTQGFNYTSVNSIHAGKDGYMYCSVADKLYRKYVAQSWWPTVKESQGRVTSFSSNSTKLIAGYTDDLLIFESTDWGTTWTTNGQIVYPTVRSILTLRNYVFVGTNDGIYTSADYGATWSAKQLSIPVNTIKLERYERIAIGTDDDTYTSGLFRSSDYGQTWVQRSCPVKEITHLIFTSDYKYYVSGYWGFYRSDDYGSTWQSLSFPASRPLDFIRLSDGRIYAPDSHDLYYTDDDLNWIDSGIDYVSLIENTSNDGIVYWNSYSDVLRYKLNGQSQWTDWSFSSYSISSLYIDENNIVFAGGIDYLRYSLFLGGVWNNIPISSGSNVIAIYKSSDGYIFAGAGIDKGLYKSNIPLVVK